MIDKETRDAIVEYRMENARKTLNDIPILVEHEMWNTAVNRLYYACFFAVSALLISIHIETQTHTGARRMLALHFTKTKKLSIKLSKFYTDLFENRQSSDYADFIYFDKETVEELYKQSIIFVDTIEKLRNDIDLNNNTYNHINS